MEAGSSSAFLSTACAINSWVWSGLFVQERWSLRSCIVTLSGQRGCVLWGWAREGQAPPPTRDGLWDPAGLHGRLHPGLSPLVTGAVGACSPAGGWSKWPSAVHGGLRGCSFVPSPLHFLPSASGRWVVL